MRTLNEVIKSVETYAKLFEKNGCFECHYREDDCVKNCFLQDELRYLKEYKDLKSAIDWHEEMEDIRKHLTNIPLTWEELRTMEGEPIWIELLYHHPEQKYEYWDIIKYFDMVEDCELIVLSKSGYLYKDLLGKEWKAYRRG
jgi:hypothetical protein